MHHEFIDRFSRLQSPVHRLAAGSKLSGALLVLLTTILLPARFEGWLGGIAALLAVVAILSRIPLRFLGLRLLMLEPFVLGVALLSLFQPDGANVFCLLVARSTLCLLTVILLSNTTPFADLLGVLTRIGVPGLLLTTLALMYRYVFVLVDEAERMHRARTSRTFGRGRAQAWRRAGELIGQLFVRSTERAERIYAAMCARGWKA